MSTYGRNFEFRAQPHQRERGARYVLNPDGDEIPFGAPVVVDEDITDSGKRQVLVLASGDVEPVPNAAGLAMYEWAHEAFYGDDPTLQTYSDKDKAPLGKSVYLAAGPRVKIVLRNISAHSFYGQRDYAARTMVDGIADATPSVVPGDLLRPHDTPSDVNGYWQVADANENAWLRVDSVDVVGDKLEASFLF